MVDETNLRLHQFAGNFCSWWRTYKFLKLWDPTPIEIIIEVERLWIIAFQPFAIFTGVRMIRTYAFLQLVDPFSECSPDTHYPLLLECLYFLYCDKLSRIQRLEQSRFRRTENTKYTRHLISMDVPARQRCGCSGPFLRPALHSPRNDPNPEMIPNPGMIPKSTPKWTPFLFTSTQKWFPINFRNGMIS